MTGLCNVAWAFVRFGLPVPSGLARGIAEAGDGDGGMGMHVSYIFGSGRCAGRARQGDNSLKDTHSLFDSGLLDSTSKSVSLFGPQTI